jgi:hypothetical protein
LAFFAQNKAKLCKNWTITLVFEKSANFFAENCRKSQKIVIITSTPGVWQCFSMFTEMYKQGQLRWHKEHLFNYYNTLSTPDGFLKKGLTDRKWRFRLFGQGCQMVYFLTRNPNFGIIWKAIEWKCLYM